MRGRENAKRNTQDKRASLGVAATWPCGAARYLSITELSAEAMDDYSLRNRECKSA